MWYLWSVLLLAWTAAAVAEGQAGAEGAAGEVATTTRAPRRTLERQGSDLVWKNWLQTNQNAPARRITTKSLFITPLICPKGQRLDRSGCVEQVITVNKEEIDRLLLDHLNAQFTSIPNDEIVYDYGDTDPGPLQLSIPINLDPQAAPLQAQEPQAQAQNAQPNYFNVDKKFEDKPNDAGIVAELELLKLQQSHNAYKDAVPTNIDGILNHNVMNNNLIPMDKPKRESTAVNMTDIKVTDNSTDKGQKEQIYGHVNIDPILYKTEHQIKTENPQNTTIANEIIPPQNDTAEQTTPLHNTNETIAKSKPIEHILKKDVDKTKLNPENEYASIGETIKLISRYAEVTTDDNFSKEQNKLAPKEESFLGTRTKLHHRRNRPKPSVASLESAEHQPSPPEQINDQIALHKIYPKYGSYYRYPWQSQHVPTPPPEYPFRHLQDYWPGKTHIGGVYANHENPRRHHHNYPHSYYKTFYLPRADPNSGVNGYYSEQLQEYPPRAVHHSRMAQVPSQNQDLYSLLGLRHWFSSEGTSKR